jgi:hypothetical protein
MREQRSAETRCFYEENITKSFTSSSSEAANKKKIYYLRNMSFVSLLDPCATEFEPTEVSYAICVN